ncbi:MAG: aminotransferase class III-fold pyridoxal phosphate-dependent enzyme [Clostridia bacterium]|nr:aminotransferase class III-fold pyridoxal phosphate-dependent enzyme [Clostridia bacterium]MBN2882906.1 aminotransferase class III-fold pyridoxal phosphate-dependent enzyme [Clostridia bacterium]
MNSFRKLTLDKSMELLKESLELTPGGMLGIRRPYNFIEGEYPVFIEKGYAGHIVDVDGNDYIDMLCSYGPIVLGHIEEEINDAVKAQMDKGFCFSLVQEIQNRLEAKLIELIPCAEMAVIAKTGSDVTTMAVRVARGFTGKNKILRCGYHGWHDWCVENHNGVPESITELTIEFEYADLDDLKSKLDANKDQVACIIITPVGHPLAKDVAIPPDGYLNGVRALADEYGAVLVFDEIRTGFRASMGGAGQLYGVIPDLACFGKAMANGYPISALVGKRDVMKVMEKDVFISSTFFPNSLEMAAALKCIEILERDNVIENIWNKGRRFLTSLEQIKKKYNAPITVSGIPPMPFITFDKVDELYKARRKEFYTQTIRRGLFIQPYHHWYICFRHTEEDMNYALKSIDEALGYVMENYPIRSKGE